MLKTSLQTITWGDPQHHLFDHIFGIASRGGFQGVEIGFRRLRQVSIGAATDLLQRHGLRLSACHIGGNLADLAQAEDERRGLSKVLEYVLALESDYLIYSGLDVDSDEALVAGINQIAEFAAQCAGSGVTLLYHNHDWEFRNGMRIWNRLLDADIDQLGFAPDLGWAVKGGCQMADLLKSVGNRSQVLHFKDFLTWDGGDDTCRLGTGIIDFAPAWKWLSGQSARSLWITAEQDNAEDKDADCQANGAWLSDHLSRIQ